VGGSLYDVSFLEGSCAELFSGCDGLDDFQFQDPASVNLATAALLDQVFIGIYDSGAFRTAGCEPNASLISIWPALPSCLTAAFGPDLIMWTLDTP
jgi:hypothetical protein